MDMQISEEKIKEMKDLLEKQSGKEVTMAEATDAAYKLVGLVEICFEHTKKEFEWKRKLEESPKGFLLEGGYSCSICKQGGDHCGGIWHDKYGHKCMTCQKSINRKEIPASVSTKEDEWYSAYDLESCFNLDRHVIKRWIKEGILKDRIITNDGKGVHFQLFLIKDNKDTLPPKKLVKSQLVKEIIDGKEWVHSEPWYRFVNAKEYLKGYKIMDYLRIVPAEEMKAREEAKKKKK
jgi:hypothetical protein